MTAEEWEDLVRRLDQEAKQDPGGYRRRVGLLAVLGYAYVGAVMLLLLGASAAVVWLASTGSWAILKILIPLVALVVIILRSLWVWFPPPEGIKLRRSDVQLLWRAIDDLRTKVAGPKVHELLLDGQLNAAIVQIPRLGPLGWYRNYLIVGLPLMQALDEEEFRSVVAHELGHLSKSHGRFSAWIYHLRLTWARLVAVLEEEEHWGTFIFRRFFGWYAPYFGAYSFALVRAHEYEADQSAADATSPNTAARALVAIVVADGALENAYWPGVFRLALTESAPPATVHGAMAGALIGAPNDARAPFWLRRALERPSTTTDTHPSLADRLKALGVPPGEELGLLASRLGEDGTATRLLGEDEAALVKVLDDEWRSGLEPGWGEEHQRLQKALARLRDLGDRSADELTAKETVERAMLTAELDGSVAAVPLLETVLARMPEDPSANYALGLALLEAGDERGLAYLDRAIQADPHVVIRASERAYDFLLERGRTEEAEQYRTRAEEHATAYFSAMEERQMVSPTDSFLPHDLPPEAVEHLRGLFDRYRAVRRVLLVRKGLWHFVDSWPLYVVALEPADPSSSDWVTADGSSLLDRIAEDIKLPSDLHLVIVEPGGEFAERLERVRDAVVFVR